MISSGRPALATLQRRQQVADVRDLLVEQQHERVVQQRDLLLGVVDEVRRQVAAVELHAFDDVELVGQALAVFDGDDAFLADLVHRLGDDLADRVVGVGRDRADLGDFLGRRRAGFEIVLELGDQRGDGLVDAALEVHRVHAGGHVLHAFAHDGLGQHGGGGGAVTGVVAGLGSDFLDHLRAHVLELVLQLDFLGHGHAVLGDRGAPNERSRTTLRPLGPSVTLTALARTFTPSTMRARASEPKMTSFAAMRCFSGIQLNEGVRTVGNRSAAGASSPPGQRNGPASLGRAQASREGLLLDDGEEVFFAHHEQFVAVDLDGLAAVLAEQHAIADLDVQDDEIALVDCACPGRRPGLRPDPASRRRRRG